MGRMEMRKVFGPALVSLMLASPAFAAKHVKARCTYADCQHAYFECTHSCNSPSTINSARLAASRMNNSASGFVIVEGRSMPFRRVAFDPIKEARGFGPPLLHAGRPQNEKSNHVAMTATNTPMAMTAILKCASLSIAPSSCRRCRNLTRN
jgi:hypothetical protein